MAKRDDIPVVPAYGHFGRLPTPDDYEVEGISPDTAGALGIR